MHLNQLVRLWRTFSLWQKRTLAAAVLLSTFGFLGVIYEVSQDFLVRVPTAGGALTEGVIGSPRFINPLLASSDADRDLTTLIYSGLLRLNENSELIPDLAESFTVSEDGREYVFTLKENLTWHDGHALTADDILFTIQKIQDPLIKSPRRIAFDEVKTEKIGDRQIKFVLKQPSAAFLENLTVGILPKHLWNVFASEIFPLNQFNTESIGSGPYKIEKIKKDSLGVPVYYDLTPFKQFALGEPNISRIRFRFYPGKDEVAAALRKGEIESVASLAAETVKSLSPKNDQQIIQIPLPRIFAVFFNQNKVGALAHKEARQALDLALDKSAIVREVLHGYGQTLNGPLPDNLMPEEVRGNLKDAKALLEKAGWVLGDEDVWEKKKNKTETERLEFTLTTGDTPELKAAAEMIQKNWQALGAKVALKIFEIGDLNQNIIRPRQYEALFFGEVLGRTPDLYSFWHSSQRIDPGLNIALYTSIKADKILEELKHTMERERRLTLYQELNKEITDAAPAVFVYTPSFLYVLPAKIQNPVIASVNNQADRFLNIHHWYIKTEKVWPWFTNNNSTSL